MAASNFNIDDLIQDAFQIITKPTDFYRRMNHTGGYAEPIIFLVVMAVIAGLILTLFSLFGTTLLGSMAIGLWAVIMFPFFAMIGSFVGSAIIFVIWKLTGSDKSFQTAYRCVAYAGAIYPITVVIGLVPYFGSVIGIAWGMYLMIVASIEVQGFTASKAYAVFGIVGALGIMFNVSNEMAARKAQAQLEQMGLSMEDIQNTGPEKAESPRGIEEVQKKEK